MTEWSIECARNTVGRSKERNNANNVCSSAQYVVIGARLLGYVGSSFISLSSFAPCLSSGCFSTVQVTMRLLLHRLIVVVIRRRFLAIDFKLSDPMTNFLSSSACFLVLITPLSAHLLSAQNLAYSPLGLTFNVPA